MSFYTRKAFVESDAYKEQRWWELDKRNILAYISRKNDWPL